MPARPPHNGDIYHMARRMPQVTFAHGARWQALTPAPSAPPACVRLSESIQARSDAPFILRGVNGACFLVWTLLGRRCSAPPNRDRSLNCSGLMRGAGGGIRTPNPLRKATSRGDCTEVHSCRSALWWVVAGEAVTHPHSGTKGSPARPAATPDRHLHSPVASCTCDATAPNPAYRMVMVHVERGPPLAGKQRIDHPACLPYPGARPQTSRIDASAPTPFGTAGNTRCRERA
jgi:hypothetical protein